jgi:hypothetical protein
MINCRSLTLHVLGIPNHLAPSLSHHFSQAIVLLLTMLRPHQDKIKVLASTGDSFIWTEVGNDRTVWKGGAIWYGGQEYARRLLAAEDDRFLRREADIYDMLGRHNRIMRSYGLECKDKGSSPLPGLYASTAPPTSFLRAWTSA